MVFGCAEPHELYPDWKRDFGRDAPLELEIGPGRGGFALDRAARHPEIDLVVIEARRWDCELIRARALKRGLRNLMVLHGDARLLLPRLFPPRSLAGLHVQFPDPWWKRRHYKRRLVDVDFAVQARRLLAPGATVDFRTDVAAYAREGERTWLQAGFERLPDEPPEVLSTRERRYAVTGQPVFRARFRNPLVDLRPIQSERTGREWRDVRRKWDKECARDEAAACHSRPRRLHAASAAPRQRGARGSGAGLRCRAAEGRRGHRVVAALQPYAEGSRRRRRARPCVRGGRRSRIRAGDALRQRAAWAPGGSACRQPDRRLRRGADGRRCRRQALPGGARGRPLARRPRPAPLISLTAKETRMADLLHPKETDQEEATETPFDPGEFGVALAADDQMEAQLLVSACEEAEMPAIVQSLRSGPVGTIASPVDGFNILVPQRDLERARALLTERKQALQADPDRSAPTAQGEQALTKKD